nr:ribonuclease H-like domain, reverse transcriptase, RNA-dependent DNA polymerase [Tanacetum cinerariifolium]
MDPGTRLTKITEGTMVNSIEYRSLIGCLRYLLHTRPDLSYSVRLLSRFMLEPRDQHMKAIRQVLCYVKGTKDYEITYKHNKGNKTHRFSDSSYGVNTQEGKGTTGIIFYYGESPISWSTQKQATVALSSCESEFIAATSTATHALWLKRLLSKHTHSKEEKVTIMVDNKSAIALMKNPVFHRRSKHVDTKYHFIRECVEREDIQVEFPCLAPEDMESLKPTKRGRLMTIEVFGKNLNYLHLLHKHILTLTSESNRGIRSHGHRRQSAFDRLSETYSPRTTKSRPQGMSSRDYPRGKSRPYSLNTSKEDRLKDREHLRGVRESYDDSFSHSYRDGNRSFHMKRRMDNESPLSNMPISDSSDGRYQRLKRYKSIDEDDLTKPWMCEEEDPFTPRIHNFKSSQRK